MRLRSGGDPYDWLFLAMARHRLGDAAEARRWLDRSLAWIETKAPRNPELIRFRDEALRLLGSGASRRTMSDRTRSHALDRGLLMKSPFTSRR